MKAILFTACAAASLIFFEFLSSGGLEASTLYETSMRDAVRESEEVRRLLITDMESVETDKGIWTRVQAEVLETFKGRARVRNLSFDVPGGKSGSRSLRVVGAPSLKKGEEYIVFLKTKRGRRQVVHWTVYQVAKEEGSGERFIVQSEERISDRGKFRGLRSRRANVLAYDEFVGQLYEELD